jgi:heat shock protein HslJ
MPSRRSLLFAAAFAPLGLAASGAAGATEPDHPLLRHSWRLAAIDGAPVVPDPQRGAPTLRFGADGRFSGSGGCNRVMGRYERDGDRLVFKDMASTLMACAGPVAALESRVLARLRGTSTWRLDGTGLVLSGPAGTLAYVPANP